MKIGFLSLPLTGHLNPMTALARKLQSRGHEVVFIGVPDIEPVVRAAGLDFVPFCENEYPPGSVAKSLGGVAKLHGLDVVRYTARELTTVLVKAALEHLPGKIAETGVNAVILDTSYRFLELVPMHLRLPYVQIWNILHFDSSGSTPLALYSWPHETSPEALARNVEGLQIFREYRVALIPIAQSYAERNGLEIDWSDPAATVSKLAVITQTPREFDFPIPDLPPQFHYAGPFHDNEGREPVTFPWDKRGTGQIRRKSERRRDWNGASRAKAPEFVGQVKVSMEGTNRSILSRENFEETNRTSARRKGQQLLNGLRPRRVTNYQEGS